MALQMQITATLPFVGATELASYVRVESTHSTKHECTALVQQRHVDGNGEIIRTDSYLFVPDLDGPNFIRQAYLHLKTLPEFANAVDC